MRFAAFTLILCGCAPLHAQVYKWVDKDGVTHYSDRAAPGAEQVEVQEAQTYSAPPVRESLRTSAPPGADSRAAAQAAEEFRYDNCAFTAPGADETFQNQYSVNTQWTLSPDLRPGDRVELILDGQLVSNVQPASLGMTLDSVYRGAHTLQLNVRDSRGRTVCETRVAFNVLQPSLLNPNRPQQNRPAQPLPLPGPRPRS